MNITWFFDPRFHVFQHDLSLAGMVAFAAAVAIGLLISATIQHEKIRLFLTRLGLDKNFVAIATSVVGLTLLISSIVVGLNLGGLPVHWEAPMPGIGISIGRLLRLVVMLVAVFWAVSSFKRFLFDRYLNRMGMDRALQYAIAQICGYFALTIFAGAVGVGVGFGLQNVTSNFISGLVVLAERPIQIGDRVELDKVAGQITAIHARSTTVLTNDNIAIVVPNSHFIEKAVTNWTHADPKVRLRIPIGVAYGSEVEKVRELLLSIAREHPAALKEPEPVVFFDGFGDNSLNFELRRLERRDEQPPAAFPQRFEFRHRTQAARGRHRDSVSAARRLHPPRAAGTC